MPIALDLSGAESFVERMSAKGVDVRWDNYDMVFWHADQRGYMNRKGAFRNGTWGFENRVAPDSNGVWRVPKIYVK